VPCRRILLLTPGQLSAIYEVAPSLSLLQLKTDGTTIVGTPVGHLAFIDTFMQAFLGKMRQEFQMLHDYPYAQEFFLLLYYCCNHKIMHLLSSIGPHIMLVATAPGRSPTAHQLEVAVQGLPGYSARSKKKPHESRTLQLTILRCFLSFCNSLLDSKSNGFQDKKIPAYIDSDEKSGHLSPLPGPML
jgi:hypothetical protein